MEYLHNGFTIEYSPGAFPFSTDSVVLSDFAKLPAKAKVLDLCSGCGTIGLLLCAKDPRCQVTGIELDPAAHETALKNIHTNHVEDRLFSICGNIASVELTAGSFDVCVSNPPYFSGGPHSKTVPLARRDDECPMDTLFTVAGRALKYGGDFFIVHRPERLAELCNCAAKYALEAKNLCLLRHRTDGPVTLILLQFRKGGKPGINWQEHSLFHSDGSPTEYYRALYHL